MKSIFIDKYLIITFFFHYRNMPKTWSCMGGTFTVGDGDIVSGMNNTVTVPPGCRLERVSGRGNTIYGPVKEMTGMQNTVFGEVGSDTGMWNIIKPPGGDTPEKVIKPTETTYVFNEPIHGEAIIFNDNRKECSRVEKVPLDNLSGQGCVINNYAENPNISANNNYTPIPNISANNLTMRNNFSSSSLFVFNNSGSDIGCIPTVGNGDQVYISDGETVIMRNGKRVDNSECVV